MIPKPKKAKKITVTKAREKAWKAFSLYIRTKGSNAGYNRCVTCGVSKPVSAIGGIQAGHFIQGRHPSVLFDERNCHPQCYHCNIGLKGNVVKYYRYMLQNYGQSVIDELEELDKQTKQMKAFMYEEIEQTYKAKLVSLSLRSTMETNL